MKDPLKISKDKSLVNLKIEYTCRLKNHNGKWFWAGSCASVLLMR